MIAEIDAAPAAEAAAEAAETASRQKTTVRFVDAPEDLIPSKE